MNTMDARRERLERLVDRALKDQPLRGAPATLGSRVWAEIERRAALPWWRRGFAYWPAGARVALVLALLALAGVLSTLTAPTATDAESAVRATLSGWFGHWSTTLGALGSAAHELAGLITRAVPATWAYAAAAVVVVLYLTCFGLGAATYRLLQARS